MKSCQNYGGKKMSINIGDLLRQKREEHNLTIEQLSEETKIQKRYLKALEEEKFGELPGEVHVKGFMRNYCKAVGLNPDEIVAIYKAQKGETIAHKEVVEPEKASNKIFIVVIIILLIIASAGYFIFDMLSSAEDDSLEQAKEIYKVVELPEDSEKLKSEITVNEKVNAEKSDVIEHAEEVKEEIKKEVKVEAKKEEIKLEIKKEKSAATEVNYTKEIRILADGKSWMEIKKNDNVAFSGIVENSEKIFKGNKDDNFELKIGNAGGVKIIYNGNDLGVLGKHRQVIRKKF